MGLGFLQVKCHSLSLSNSVKAFKANTLLLNFDNSTQYLFCPGFRLRWQIIVSVMCLADAAEEYSHNAYTWDYIPLNQPP